MSATMLQDTGDIIIETRDLTKHYGGVHALEGADFILRNGEHVAIMDEPTAALGVQETTQVENIIKTLKTQGEPLILISHNMRQVFDLVDRIVVFRRGRVVANLSRDETDPQDVVAYITGAKTGEEYAGAA